MDLHSLSKPLAIVGPLLAAIGAALLAYDALQGPMQFQLQRRFKSRAEGILHRHRYLSTTYPSPPYTDEEVAAARAQLNMEQDDGLAELEAEAAASELRYRLLVSNLGFWGFILVTIGSLAQVIAAWVAS